VIVAELASVTKAFGNVRAVDGVSFAVRAGEVLALLGANGAGKTTAISLLLGLRRPDEGAARIFGADPRDPGSRRRLGATPQESVFPATLRVRELVELVRAHYQAPEAVESLLERFRLRGLAARQVGGLSGGERRRLGVALAFAGRARLVILDEPTAGLDSDARHAVWAAVRDHASGGGSMLLTTHHLGEAAALASRFVLLEAGRVAADGTLDEALAAARGRP
jgi:ABC-2 type transport system ATP-binding protein